MYNTVIIVWITVILSGKQWYSCIFTDNTTSCEKKDRQDILCLWNNISVGRVWVASIFCLSIYLSELVSTINLSVVVDVDMSPTALNPDAAPLSLALFLPIRTV